MKEKIKIYENEIDNNEKKNDFDRNDLLELRNKYQNELEENQKLNNIIEELKMNNDRYFKTASEESDAVELFGVDQAKMAPHSWESSMGSTNMKLRCSSCWRG